MSESIDRETNAEAGQIQPCLTPSWFTDSAGSRTRHSIENILHGFAANQTATLLSKPLDISHNRTEATTRKRFPQLRSVSCGGSERKPSTLDDNKSDVSLSAVPATDTQWIFSDKESSLSYETNPALSITKSCSKQPSTEEKINDSESHGGKVTASKSRNKDESRKTNSTTAYLPGHNVSDMVEEGNLSDKEVLGERGFKDLSKVVSRIKDLQDLSVNVRDIFEFSRRHSFVCEQNLSYTDFSAPGNQSAIRENNLKKSLYMDMETDEHEWHPEQSLPRQKLASKPFLSAIRSYSDNKPDTDDMNDEEFSDNQPLFQHRRACKTLSTDRITSHLIFKQDTKLEHNRISTLSHVMSQKQHMFIPNFLCHSLEDLAQRPDGFTDLEEVRGEAMANIKHTKKTPRCSANDHIQSMSALTAPVKNNRNLQESHDFHGIEGHGMSHDHAGTCDIKSGSDTKEDYAGSSSCLVERPGRPATPSQYRNRQKEMPQDGERILLNDTRTMKYRVDEAAFNNLSLTNSGVKVTLLNSALWKAFNSVGTEMIINRGGRRMFPYLALSVSGLVPDALYDVTLEILPASPRRFKYINTKWVPVGVADAETLQAPYIHPDSPNTGSHFSKIKIIFSKVKLTNNKDSAAENILLHSMHKYRIVTSFKRIGSTENHLGEVKSISFRFSETDFIAVTAYQNEAVTQMKIHNNPFAKAFRDVNFTTSRGNLVSRRRKQPTDGCSHTNRARCHPKSLRSSFPASGGRLSSCITESSLPAPVTPPAGPLSMTSTLLQGSGTGPWSLLRSKPDLSGPRVQEPAVTTLGFPYFTPWMSLCPSLLQPTLYPPLCLPHQLPILPTGTPAQQSDTRDRYDTNAATCCHNPSNSSSPSS